MQRKLLGIINVDFDADHIFCIRSILEKNRNTLKFMLFGWSPCHVHHPCSWKGAELWSKLCLVGSSLLT